MKKCKNAKVNGGWRLGGGGGLVFLYWPQVSVVVNTLLPWLLGKHPYFAQKHNAKSLSHAFPGAVVNYIFSLAVGPRLDAQS